MTDEPNVETTLSSKEDAAKTNALIAYCLMIAGLFTGIFWIIGAVWAMVKRPDASATRFEDHYSNIVKTFWWGLGLSILGALFAVVLIGYLLLIGVWIWSIYRIVKGLAQLTSNRPFYQ